jgi:hypothetical protein
MPSCLTLPGRASLLGLVLLGSGATPAPAEPLEPGRVPTCMEANAPDRSIALSVALDSQDRAGDRFGHEVEILWRRGEDGRSETLLCLESPLSIRGLAYLILGEGASRRAWVYLPAEERAVRFQGKQLSSQARIAQTALSYEDLRYVPIHLGNVRPEPIGTSHVAGRPVTVVELSLPAGEDSPYERVVARVDLETCVPLEIEFYDAAGVRQKLASADPASIVLHGGTALARSLRIADTERQVETTLRIDRVEVDADIPSRRFTLAGLEGGRCGAHVP